MRMNELAARILGWANDRNLIEGSTVEKQNVKLVEEFGEFAAGLARGKVDVQADALGDMMVILIIMAKQAEVNIPAVISKLAVEEFVDFDELAVANAAGFTRIGVSCAFLLACSQVGDISTSLYFSEPVDESVSLCFAMCLNLCLELQLAPAKVLEDVWNIIKDRKGKMVDGVFVKENDAMMDSGSNAQ